MFKSLQDFFSDKLSDSEPSQADLKLAAATLMFELIRSDGRIDKIERDTMTQILQTQFELSNDDCVSLFEMAQKSAEDAISLHSFTREICEQWDNPQREKLVENLWTLALADNTVDPHERHLVRKVAGLLYLNDAQIAKARERAKQTVIN